MPRTLFVGDVHGCSRELKRLLKKTRPTRVILLGDLFTRGPDPGGVWKLVRRYGAETVIGNHDVDVLANWSPGGELPRRAFRYLQRSPWMRRGNGWIAVHAGLDPVKVRRTTRRQALYMRDFRGRPWWEQYEGRRLALFGHHAAVGLIDRRPYAVGLDLGCVRGGGLAGYLLEDNEIVGVTASR